MNLPQTGGCLCGKIRCEITEAPQRVYTCHCIACQHQTSSAFSLEAPCRRRASASRLVNPEHSNATRIAVR